jgi:hypothetical protein
VVLELASPARNIAQKARFKAGGHVDVTLKGIPAGILVGDTVMLD